MKRMCWTAMLLAVCLLASLLPAYAQTVQTQTVVLEDELIYVSEENVVSLLDDGGIALKEGHYPNWIDRIADLPDYANQFYHWLEENANPGGALVNPNKGERLSSFYGHTVAVFEDTVPFTYDPENCTADSIQEAAYAAVCAASETQVQEAVDYTPAVYSAFDRDHPEVFWLSGDCSFGSGIQFGLSYVPGSGQGTASYTRKVYFVLESGGFDIRAEEYDGKHGGREIKDEMEEIQENISEILSGDFPENGTRQEQLQYLNRWLTRNNEYNTSSDLNKIGHDCRECVSALDGEVGTEGPVCEGYAKAFKVLCDRLEIPCVLENGIAGTAPGLQENHMWNLVQMLDGQWYAVDVTWNDPKVIRIDPRGKEKDDDEGISGGERDTYLLVGAETVIDGSPFVQTHFTTNVVTLNGLAFTNGPVLSAQAYVPGKENLEHVDYGWQIEDPEKVEVTFEVPETMKEQTYNILLVAYDHGRLALISMETVTGSADLHLTMERKGLPEDCTFKAFLLGDDMHPIDHAGDWEPKSSERN